MTKDRVKVAYIVSGVDKSLGLEWLFDSIDRHLFEPKFILIGSIGSPLKKFLDSRNAVVYEHKFQSKLQLIPIFFSILIKLAAFKPQIIHTHLLEANLLGLTAAWILRIPKRIYTRHHAVIHHREYPSGLKFDKWCNKICTTIVAPSENVRSILINLEQVPDSKVELIHHGFDFNYFSNISSERIEIVKNRYGISNKDYPIIGVIARYTEWKGIQYIIPAFEKLYHDFPKAKLILANAGGDYVYHLRDLLKSIADDRVVEIPFEHDLAALYKIFDVYIHTPIDPASEAFGQTYIEALIAERICIFTKSGIANQLPACPNINWVNFKDSDGIFQSAKTILSRKQSKQDLSVARNRLVNLFGIKTHIDNIQSLYLE